MTNKLALYNLALGTYVGSQHLANLTENRAERYALDRVYESSLLYMLELGLWKFALRTAKLEPEVTSPNDELRQHSYLIPDDFVRLAGISPQSRFDHQFEDYLEENGRWYADIDPMWVRYVSKDDAYGMDLDLYPANYEQAVASWLAYQSVLPISKDRGDRADLLRLHQTTLATSRRLDAVDEAIKRKPPGRWPRARGWGFNGTSRGLR